MKSKLMKFYVALAGAFGVLGTVLADGQVDSIEFGTVATAFIAAGLVWLLPNAKDETREAVAEDVAEALEDLLRQVRPTDQADRPGSSAVALESDLGTTFDGQPKRRS